MRSSRRGSRTVQRAFEQAGVIEMLPFQDEDDIAATRLGAIDFLSKPITPDALAAAILLARKNPPSFFEIALLVGHEEPDIRRRIRDPDMNGVGGLCGGVGVGRGRGARGVARQHRPRLDHP